MYYRFIFAAFPDINFTLLKKERYLSAFCLYQYGPDETKLSMDGYMGKHEESFCTRLYTGGAKGAWKYLKGYPFPFIRVTTRVFGLLRLSAQIRFLCNKRYDKSIRIVLAPFVFYFAVITGPVANVLSSAGTDRVYLFLD